MNLISTTNVKKYLFIEPFQTAAFSGKLLRSGSGDHRHTVREFVGLTLGTEEGGFAGEFAATITAHTHFVDDVILDHMELAALLALEAGAAEGMAGVHEADDLFAVSAFLASDPPGASHTLKITPGVFFPLLPDGSVSLCVTFICPFLLIV